MTTQTLRNGDGKDLAIKPGESIQIVAVTGSYTASIIAGVGAPSVVATDATGGNYGPYATGAVVRLRSSPLSEVDFEIGTAPAVISDTPVMASKTLTGGIETIGISPSGLRGIGSGLAYRGVSAGLRACSDYTAQEASNKSRYFRIRRRAVVDMVGSVSILFPTFYRSRPGAYTIDIDFPDSFRMAAALEPVFVESATGLNPSARIIGTGADGAVAQQYTVGVGPFGYIEFFFNLTSPIKKGDEYGIWYVLENTSQTVGPFNFPRTAQAVGTAQFESYEGTDGAVSSYINSNFLGTATGVAPIATGVQRYAPCAVLAAVPEGLESWMVIGDSIPEGAYDSDIDARGSKSALLGYADKLIGGKWQKPCINLSKGSDRWNYMANADAISRTVMLMARCNPTHIHTQLGTNDLAGGRTAAQMASDAALVIGKWAQACPQARMVGGTILPQSSSTDSFATVHNQTPSFPPIARRGTGGHRALWHSQHVRGVSSVVKFDDYIELSHIENDPINHDSYWRSLDGTTALPYCANDGTHPNTRGSIYISDNATLGSTNALQPQGSVVLLAKFAKADMNTTSDQRIFINPKITRYRLTKIVVVGASVSMTTAAGGIYSALSKAGVAYVPASQNYAALTSAVKVLEPTLQNAADVVTATVLYLSLTAAQGVASTADFYLYGEDLS